ncbi:hypothetical protein KUTeg_009256 [Tegillarca granosa]|uniref:Transposable element P transposase-like RNase H domain-containing protein n=1 Tax=Tegillarca granosa TaxID=220873 RepID=A0ABQ9F733_TEGGR|nr:hypothetical protein KUTeg_009256 [Tegillarca granosa]
MVQPHESIQKPDDGKKQTTLSLFSSVTFPSNPFTSSSERLTVKITSHPTFKWSFSTACIPLVSPSSSQGFYSKDCVTENLQCLPRNTFFRILPKLFPSVKSSHIRVSSGRKHIYTGISFNDLDTRYGEELLQISNIQNHLYYNTFLMYKTESYVKIGMMSNILANDNVIIKEVTLNFTTRKWNLKIRGKTIAFKRLGVSDNFNNTVSNLRTILYIVKMIRICTGLDVVQKKAIPVRIICEKISYVSDENFGGIRKMRCGSCCSVLGWCSIGDSCINCIKLLNEFKQSEQENLINLDNIDKEDLSSIFNVVFPNATPEMNIFLTNQYDALMANNPRSRKWDRSVIKACLSLWSRSPQSYQDLRDSNLFILPSGGVLQRYKNITPQNSGINLGIFLWMSNTAKSINLPPSGYCGGIVRDEAKIQEDIVINVKGKENKLIGWIDTGEEAENVRILMQQDVKQTVASSVLQISFLGYTGFRFPIAHYPTAGASAYELYTIIWEIISYLQSWNFTTDFILQDGGDQNREFMKIHFNNDEHAKQSKYMGDNVVNPGRKIAHSQDFSHNIKKIRNAVLSSGTHKYNTKKLMRGDQYIVWDMWINAAQWDENTNSRKIHHKLSSSHLHPDSSEKMRNHLSEEVLDSDMFHLMKSCRDSLQNGNVLDSAVEFLENTISPQ